VDHPGARADGLAPGEVRWDDCYALPAGAVGVEALRAQEEPFAVRGDGDPVVECRRAEFVERLGEVLGFGTVGRVDAVDVPGFGAGRDRFEDDLAVA
jgi:hypothetical protein